MEISAHALGIRVIVNNICKYLSLVELLQIEEVCKLWQNSVHQTLSQRKDSLILVSQNETFASLENVNSNQSTLRSVAKEKAIEKVFLTFLKWRNKWMVLPETVFLICTSFSTNFLTSKVIKNKLFLRIQSTLPYSCRLILVMNLAPDEHNVSDDEHLFWLNSWALAPTVQLSSVLFTCSKFKTSKTKGNLLKELDCLLEQQTNLKLCLVFLHVTNQREYSWSSDILLPKMNKNVCKKMGACVFGAFVADRTSIGNIISENPEACDTPPCQTNAEFDFLSYMFCGENISVSSVVLQCRSFQDRTEPKEEFEKRINNKLSRLKQSVGAKKVLLKFCVSCCSQKGITKTIERKVGDKLVKYSLIEAAFNDAFPNLPTFNLIGGGEIGLDYNLVGEQELNDDSLDRQFCSIFAVVSY